MDGIQENVVSLNGKVDALQQKLEQLSLQAAEILTEMKLLGGSSRAQGVSFMGRSGSSYRTPDPSMEHKDVLSDSGFESDSQMSDRVLSPEVQVQRLTAQLTAAYNRIAALEEQLLSHRVH
jgi:hypothetical protein